MQSPKAQSPKAQSPKAQSPKAQSPIVQFLRTLFNNQLKVLPQVIDITKIDKIMDKNFLAELEYQYDKFLNANMQILDLYNVIDYLLDVRDAILLKLNRMTREEQIRKHNDECYTKSKNKTQPEPQTKILIEYNCGCQNLIHYNPNLDNTISNSNITSNSSRHHCLDHLNLIKRQSFLECELIKVKDELLNVTARQNIKSINYCK
jgi:hypothetical protein